jgi:hypothetical protein
MSRYAPGYTGPMTTAGGVKPKTKPKATGTPVRNATPTRTGMAMGGMTKKAMAYGGMTKKGMAKGGMTKGKK